MVSHFDASFLEEADMAFLRGVLGAPSRQPVPAATQVQERRPGRRRHHSMSTRSAPALTPRLQRGAA
jgi:hypothetical protein